MLFGPEGFAGNSNGTDLTQEELLGLALYKDEQLSLNRNQACASCHTLVPQAVNSPGSKRQRLQPAASFVDPDNIRNGTPVSDGSDPTLFGGLNAPSAGYAAFSPPFHYDAQEGLYIGGQFWNGRAAKLNDQAKGPFTNPVEMGMPNKAAVIERLQEDRDYLEKFIKVYGIDLAAIQTNGTDPGGVDAAYHAMSLAIEAFERTAVFNRFDSKFDFVETGWIDYTESEQRGADIFDAVCAGCHEGTREDANGNLVQGLMTDFSYDNLGVPANPAIPGGPDLGLAGNPTVIADARQALRAGKQKVMSLRNIELTPPYMHNGVFPTLEMVVHFYNTRDVLPKCETLPDPVMGQNCWPAPEVAENVNAEELGNLLLTPEQEADLVAYLKTFTDGYPQWGNDPAVPNGSTPGYLYALPEVLPER